MGINVSSQHLQLIFGYTCIELNIPVMIRDFLFVAKHRSDGKVTYLKALSVSKTLKGFFSLINIECFPIFIQYITYAALDHKSEWIQGGKFNNIIKLVTPKSGISR